MNSKEWPESRVQELRRLWDTGMSTAKIAFVMGVSKNGIVGKAHRLDLAGRPSPIKRGIQVTPPQRAVRAPKQTLPELQESAVVAVCPAPVPMVRPEVTTAPRPVAQPFRAPAPPVIRADAPAAPFTRSGCLCQWIDGAARPWKTCDDPAVQGPEGWAWCAAHRAKVYVPIKRMPPAAPAFVSLQDRTMGRLMLTGRAHG